MIRRSPPGFHLTIRKFEGRPVIIREGLRLLFIALRVTEIDALVPPEAHSVCDERITRLVLLLGARPQPVDNPRSFPHLPRHSVLKIGVLVRVLAKMGPA